MYPLPQSTFSRGPSTALERRGLMFCTMVSTRGQSSRTLETKALARAGRGGGHQGHQHPSGGPAVAHQHMADKPRAPILLVGLVPAEPGGPPHRLHRLVQGGVVEQAGVHRHHPVGARGVDAAVQPPARPGTEGGDGLVAVVPGVLHPQDGGHRPELPSSASTRACFWRSCSG